MKVNISKFAPLVIFIAALAVVYGASTASRLMQIERGWKAHPAQYYVDDVPMVNTLDAYKWVRMGEEYKEGKYNTSENDTLMYFPDGRPRENPVPLLSIMLAGISSFFNGNLYEAGLHLVPFLAGLFIFPFGIYFYRLGYPAAGVLGGFCGTFAGMYYGRTTAGRIDTDCLNLFFLFLTALFIMLASDRKKNREIWAFSAAAGLAQLLFTWWYDHPAFILMFCGVLVVSLALYRRKIKDIAIAAGVYIVFSNPVFFKDSLVNMFSLLNSYILSPVSISGGFPNVYQTVSEAKATPVGEILNGIFIHPVMVFIALGAFVLLTVRNPKKVLPLLPVLAMGLLIFKSSGRFVVFMIPFLGAGIGYLLNFAAAKIPSSVIKREWVKSAAAHGAVGLFVLMIALLPRPAGFAASYSNQGKTSVFFAVPQPSIDTDMYRTFNMLRDRLPAGSAVYTWWDFGLAIEAQARLATFHDGMSQNTSKTWLIARSMLASPEMAVRYISYISNKGVNPIEEKRRKGRITAAEVLKDVENYSEPLMDDRIYLSFTYDMVWKYGAIKEIGAWDIVNSRSAPWEGAIDMRQCAAPAGRMVSCGGVNIDTMLGVVNNNTPLKKIDYVNTGGRVVKEQDTGLSSSLHAIVMQDGGRSHAVFLMNEKDYNSMFVQLYLLGKYDPRFYEEVISVYPLTRVFHVKNGQAVQ